MVPSRARRRVQGATVEPDVDLAEQRRVVDVFLDPKKQLHLSLSMVPADQPNQATPNPDQFAEQVTARENDPQSMELMSVPLWYVYSPETTLKSLAVPW